MTATASQSKTITALVNTANESRKKDRTNFHTEPAKTGIFLNIYLSEFVLRYFIKGNGAVGSYKKIPC